VVYCTHMEVHATYTWTQTQKQITIFMPILAKIKSRDIVYTLTTTSLILGIKGETPAIDGLMINTVKPGDSWWEIEVVNGKRSVKAVIRKDADDKMWNYLLKSL
jgi:hypothetical protein